jgi:hypothetical protein
MLTPAEVKPLLKLELAAVNALLHFFEIFLLRRRLLALNHKNRGSH